jgi:hypothetical protein
LAAVEMLDLGNTHESHVLIAGSYAPRQRADSQPSNHGAVLSVPVEVRFGVFCTFPSALCRHVDCSFFPTSPFTLSCGRIKRTLGAPVGRRNGVIGGNLVSDLSRHIVRPMGLRSGMGSISRCMESFVAIVSPNVNAERALRCTDPVAPRKHRRTHGYCSFEASIVRRSTVKTDRGRHVNLTLRYVLEKSCRPHYDDEMLPVPRYA